VVLDVLLIVSKLQQGAGKCTHNIRADLSGGEGAGFAFEIGSVWKNAG
jgi:hypothetical protein